MSLSKRHGSRLGLSFFALLLMQACPSPHITKYDPGSVFDGSINSLSACTPDGESAADGLERLTQKQLSNVYLDILPASFATLKGDISSVTAVITETTATNRAETRFSRFTTNLDAITLRSL